MAGRLASQVRGLSEAQFREAYGSEAQCRAVVEKLRWPTGFVCPVCGGCEGTRLSTRPKIQCRACRHQVSLTAGTIFHVTKLPLTTWFLAMWLIATARNGISPVELARAPAATLRSSPGCGAGAGSRGWSAAFSRARARLRREAGVLPPGSPGSCARAGPPSLAEAALLERVRAVHAISRETSCQLREAWICGLRCSAAGRSAALPATAIRQDVSAAELCRPAAPS